MKAIETDSGPAFKNKIMAELCKLLNIQHILRIPMHAAGNAMVERTNTTLMSSLKLVCAKQDDCAQNMAAFLRVLPIRWRRF